MTLSFLPRKTKGLNRLGALTAISTIAFVQACAPHARPLVGTATHAALPSLELPFGNRQMNFTWKYQDDTFEANGDGVVRASSPDHARLDFFLKGGLGGGMAILVGDSLIIPGIELVRRFLPPVPLLWATLGRLAVPATPDTIARVDGDTLRADLGVLHGTDAAKAGAKAWRIALVGRSLARVERIENGKVVEWISRTATSDGKGELRYVNAGGRRSLSISLSDTRTAEAFDDAIWRRP